MRSRSPERIPWGTLRVRLAIWNTAVVLAMTVAALLATRFAAKATLMDAVDQELRGGLQEVVLALRDLLPDLDAVIAEMQRKASSHEDRGWFIQMVTEDGTPVWRSRYCPDTVANFPPSRLDRVENIVQVGPYRYVRLRIAEPGQPVFHVRVGTSTTGLDASLAGLVRVLVGVGIVLCGLTPLAGWWLAVRATRPVSDILRTADRLRPTRLMDRLPIRGTDDELDHVARTINRLLDDVAAHVDRQQEFVADAAHELRGPLAAIQSRIEVALSHDRSSSEYREALGEVLEEASSLSKLANDLLLLAESAATDLPAPPTTVDLAALAGQAVSMFAGVAEDRGVSLRATCGDDGPAVVGDAGQVRRVIGNLLDNAIRFTPSGGAVTISVGAAGDDGLATLVVSDTGLGIAAVHLPRLFDRFFKVDPARSRGDAGIRSGGLGLPICKAIVERLGGTIAVSSRPGAGTTVTVRLPRAAGPASAPEADLRPLAASSPASATAATVPISG